MILVSLQLLIGLFFSILFLQSGLDKVFDFKGNKGYIGSVFANTFLKPLAPMLFMVITLLEIAAGFLCAAGCIYYFFNDNETLLLMGLQLSALSLLCLFFGQRIAKDYAGAGGLVAYFLVAAFGIYLFV
ncbi:MAG: DoxX family membrane protein [Chitinophagaceae bacterium]|nr:MAG: DoxX family membrane protein [Chitinophagaceae bacterium]